MALLSNTTMALTGSSAMSVILMALGFGLVIFVHELGHFLAAKMVGIRVEQFAIGFGRKLIGFTHGETEYRINVLPLGGYVKMPGQEDFDLHNEDDPARNDPHAFNNRPIWARMIVVSAGVVMNIILAAVLFVIIFSIGREYIPSRVGATAPGYPAEKAVLEGIDQPGLIGGDVIEAIDGKPIYSFTELRMAAILSGPDETFTMAVRRPGVDKLLTATVGVAPQIQASGGIGHIFGISPSLDTRLSDEPGLEEYLAAISGDILKGGETIIEVNGVKITDGWQLQSIDDRIGPEPARVTVVRNGETDAPLTAEVETVIGWSPEVERRAVQEGMAKNQTPPFMPEEFNVAGLKPRVLVDAAQPDSPAAAAGLKHGDIVASFGPAYETVSLGRMQRICAENAGKSVEIRVLRDGKIAPEISKVSIGERKGTAMIGVVCLPEKNRAVVGGIADSSPFTGQITPGDTIVSVNGRPVTGWPDVIGALAEIDADKTCVIGYRTPAGAEETTAPVPMKAIAFKESDYAYSLTKILPVDQLTAIRKSANPWQAVRWGAQATGNFVITTYATLKGFFTGRVSGKEFSGPIGIFRLGVSAGQRGLMWLLWLLAIISANLAVINFLPLPIVDGGLAVLLIIEKVRGKPLSIKVQNIIQIAGLVLIAVAFVLLTYNDIMQWLTSRW